MSPQPDPTNHLPEIYRSHPSRPRPHKPTPAARQAVIVVFPTPITPSDSQKLMELQAVRKGWDHAWERWLPHVTLVPPFSIPGDGAMESARKEKTDEGEIDTTRFEHRSSAGNSPAEERTETEHQIHALLQHACARFKSHTLNLSSINTFPLRSYTNVHLRPAEDEGYGELVALQGALERALGSFLGGDEKPMNRAERRREDRATKAPQTPSTASAIASSTPPRNPPPGIPSASGRTYTRPMYREAEDEARCITLPSTEITIEPVPNDCSAHSPARAGTDSRGTVVPPPSPRRPIDPISSAYQPVNRPAHRSRANGTNRAFTPHLTIGQARTPSSRDHLVSLARQIIDGDPATQEPSGIKCRIDRVWFLSKPVGAAGPYEVVASIPLASKDAGQ